MPRKEHMLLIMAVTPWARCLAPMPSTHPHSTSRCKLSLLCSNNGSSYYASNSSSIIVLLHVAAELMQRQQ